jgi:putative addiction module component (TIGR02574 family)
MQPGEELVIVSHRALPLLPSGVNYHANCLSEVRKMTREAAQILSEALRLPESDRAIVARQLLETLSPDSPEILDDELEAELDRRLEEFHRDPATAIPWPELRRELQG